LVEVVFCSFPAKPLHNDLPDSRTFLLIGQIDKEDLIEPPFPNNSGGSWLMSLAVATTNTGLVFSCNQLMSVPTTLEEVPPSEEPERTPL